VNIVSIDPSLRNTGIFTRIDGKFDADVFQPKSKDRVKALSELLLYFVNLPKGFDLCLIEDYDPGAKGTQARVQGEVGGIIRACFQARGVPVIEVPIQSWKSVTGISLKKGTTMADSDYLNAVANKYKIRLQTTHEADAYLIFHCVRMSAKKLLPQIGAQNIRHRLEELKIDFADL
jgi:hypothetical protein